MIIAIDFDGTLHKGEWPSIGEPSDGAVEAMRKLRDDGHYLIINTCREGTHQTEMVNWLRERQIPFHRVNDNAPDHVGKYGGNCRKIYAHLYVDDRQVGGLPAWDEILEYARVREKIYRETHKNG
ncbi:MAG: HAD hydrolase family protein [Mediterranea sp.]|jgi:hypothetical protein|nr:HAD hydrolase family protein [Mediterranea sp.]